MHDRVLRFRGPNLAFLTTVLYLCAKSYFSFDQPERSQSVDPNEDNNENQSKTFKECQNIIWKSEHRNDQKSEYKWQNSLQSLCADQNQNRVRMFEIFQGGLSQSPAAKPYDSNNQINENACDQGNRQFPFPARLAEPG